MGKKWEEFTEIFLNISKLIHLLKKGSEKENEWTS